MTNEIEQWSDAEQAELKKVFYAGAHEIVENLQDALLALEAGSDHDEPAMIKRYIHTLKGDSNSVGLTSVGTLCHRMEDVLSSVTGAGDALHDAREAVDLLLSSVDAVRALLLKSEAGEGGDDAGEMIRKIDQYLAGESGAAASAAPVLSEYEELQAQEAVQNGLFVYDVEIVFHPECRERGVAARMAAQHLAGLGRIIHAAPSVESDEIDRADRMTAVFATDREREAIRRGALITGITSEVVMREHRCRSCEVRREECGAENAVQNGSGMPQAGGGVPVAIESKPGERLQSPPAPSSQGEFLRIEASRVDRIMNLVGELIIGRSMIEQMAREMAAGTFTSDGGAARLHSANAYLERTISDLQKGVMKMRMVPVHQVFRKFPKMVRDLSAEKKKPVRLEIFGKETELDKGIVDGLGEPLAHIIRNMIDHGIEDSAERLGLGKPEEGIITLKAYHEASRIVIEVSDDGRGIDIEKLKGRAVENGFLRPEEAANMPDGEAVNLIFLTGLSTADAVTDTSGRGVGMDAVKAAVEGMRGTVEVHSTQRKGTMIRLRLPLTLAVIRALLFEAGDTLYAVPVSIIAEVVKVVTDTLATVNGRRTLMLRDQVISLISMQELFNGGEGSEGKKFVLIIGAGARKVGLLVDRLMWQQELVIKAVDGLPARSGLVAGASILGNGKVIMVLDALAIVRRAVNEERKRRAAA